MNKLLRTFAIVALGFVATGVGAQTVLFEETFSKCTGTTAITDATPTTTELTDNAGWVFTKTYKNDGEVRCGTGSALGNATTPALSNLTSADATLTFKAKSWNAKESSKVLLLSISSGTLSVSSVTLDGDSYTTYKVKISGGSETSKITFSAKVKSNNRFFLDDVKIVSGWDNTEGLAKPTISASATSFEESTIITITAATGATIYYTTDGTTPTAESTQYTEPFSVTETATIKAIAVKDEETSDVSSQTVTKTTITTMTFAEAYDWCIAQDYTKTVKHDGYVKITFENAKVLYVDANQIYVRQGEKAMQFYGFPFSEKAVVANDILNGTYIGQLQAYKGIPELSASTNVTTAANVTVTNSTEAAAPISATVAEVEARTYICDYVEFNNVKLTKDATYYWISKNGSNVEIANPKVADNKSGLLPTEDYEKKTYTIKAVVTGTYQNEGTVTVLSCAEDGSITVKEPEYSLSNDAYVYEGQSVVITADDGLTVYYTTDGTTPTTESAVYSDAIEITATTTKINAIAVNADNEVSDVVTLELNIVTDEYSIGDFQKLADGTIGIIALNKADIKYINGDNVYVTDETGSILFYKIDFSKYAVGYALSGKIVVKYTNYNGTNEAVAVSGTTVNFKASAGDEDPYELTVADAKADIYTEALATIKGYVKKSDSNYYLVENYTDEATTGLKIYIKFSDVKKSDLVESNDEELKATITGVVSKYVTSENVEWEILPTSVDIPLATAVRTINVNTFDENAPIYNLQGQRVDKNTKGILIQNGKKFIVK